MYVEAIMTYDSSQGTSKQEPSLDDLNSKEQWEAINDHLKQMHLWTESIPSPLSTSPANKNIVTRSHNNQHNPLYRRSEGDIKSPTFELQKPIKPPQSAPVLLEDYELNWQNQDPNYYLNNYSLPDHSPSNHNEDYKVLVSQNSFNNDSSFVNPIDNEAKKEKKKEELIADFVSGDASYKNSSYSHAHSPGVAKYGGRIIHSSVSSPSLKVKNMNPNQFLGDKVADFHNSSYPATSQMMSTVKYMNSPSSRRKSAPNTGLYHVAPQIAISPSRQPIGIQQTSFPSLDKIKLPNFDEIEESNAEVDLDNDREYTRGNFVLKKTYCKINTRLFLNNETNLTNIY